MAVSFARGMTAVGRSPALLALTFLSVLGFWLAFSGYGVIRSAGPQAMVLLLSLPPFSTFLDYIFLVGGRTVSLVEVVAFSSGLVLIRAVIVSVSVSLILDALQRVTGPVDLRSSIRRAVGSFVPMIGIQFGFLMLGSFSFQLIGSLLGLLGVLLVVGVGLYFFSYAAVITVAEKEWTIRAAQLSIRAARVPGRQHLTFIISYLILTWILAGITPVSRVSSATPSVAAWAFALLVGLLHVSVLGALTYRWLLIRDHALAAAQQRGKQRARA